MARKLRVEFVGASRLATMAIFITAMLLSAGCTSINWSDGNVTYSDNNARHADAENIDERTGQPVPPVRP